MIIYYDYILSFRTSFNKKKKYYSTDSLLGIRIIRIVADSLWGIRIIADSLRGIMPI